MRAGYIPARASRRGGGVAGRSTRSATAARLTTEEIRRVAGLSPGWTRSGAGRASDGWRARRQIERAGWRNGREDLRGFPVPSERRSLRVPDLLSALGRGAADETDDHRVALRRCRVRDGPAGRG